MTRPATLLRSLALIALLAAASAVVVLNDREASGIYQRDYGDAWRPRRWPTPARSLVGPVLRLGSDLTAALIVLSLGLGLGLVAHRRPTLPGHGRGWPGRGRAAIAVAALASANGLLRVALQAIADPTAAFGPSYPRFLSHALGNCEFASKNAVFGAWALLILAGRWRSEADGLERLGRLLGWAWLASIAFDLLRAALR